jgi:hypothetical protein
MVQDTGSLSNVVVLEATILGGAFDPATLPGAEVVVDISDITTLWQGNDGATQVTTSGQTVGSVTNRGSKGGLFINTGGTTEPVYTEAAGRKHLNFDGSNDFLTLTLASGNFTLSGGYWLWVLAYDDGTSASGNRAMLSIANTATTATNSAHGLEMKVCGFSTDTFAIQVAAGPNNTGGFRSELTDSRTTSLPWAMLECEFVPTAASPNGWLRIEKTGDGAPVDIANYGTSGTGGYPNGATLAKRMTIGASMNGTGGVLNAWGKCSIAAVVLISGALSASDRDDIRQWLRTRAAF